MTKDPRNRIDEESDDTPTIDRDACDVAETLPGYQEFIKESRSENLTFGDY